MTSPALAAVIEQLHRQPSRTWSVVVTVYGDAVVPRGGSLWLGTLLDVFRALGINEGAVRTAVSRLAADGWLDRRRVGRNSFYSLAERGRTTFADATRQIYSDRPVSWDGRLIMVLPDDGPDRASIVAALTGAGFGTIMPGVMLATGPCELPDAASGEVLLETVPSRNAAARLAARAWPLDRAADAYRRFIAAFAPLAAEARSGALASDEAAFTARILTIHAYRRVVLRDPHLPPALLPASWPGDEARAVCRGIYGSVLRTSERWLDQHGASAVGPLPPPDQSLWHRFT